MQRPYFFNRRIALRAERWHFKRFFLSISFIFYYRKDLRYHVAGPFHNYGVTYPCVLPVYLVLVVEGRPLYCYAPDRNRKKNSNRRKRAGSSNADHDIFNHRCFLFGGELEGKRPSRASCTYIEFFLKA